MGFDTDVVIAGAGPGGLALAQGLIKHGISVALIEKDRTRTDYVQGFRLRLRKRGYDALVQNLSEPLRAAFDATVGKAPLRSVLVDEHLAALPAAGLTRSPEDATDDVLADRSVSRITLRQILLTGLEDVIHHGTFERYEIEPDRVVAYFEDGRTLTGKILVGADGVASRVRRQLLPHATFIDTGVRRLAGKITLARAGQLGLNRDLLDSNVIVQPRSGRSLMITSHRVDPAAFARFGLIGSDDPSHAGIGGFHFDNTTSYVWWNTAYGRGELGSDDDLAEHDGAGLIAALLTKLPDWHPDLRALLQHSEPSTVALLKVRSSVPVEPWRTRRVTLLGDAIHAMTYFRALGGNTAIYDSGLLVRELAAAFAGGKPLLSALADYERAMLEHGTNAVETSLSAMRRHVFGPEFAPARA